LVLLASAQLRAERVIYVNAAATGAGDGTSWCSPYSDLQDALDDARVSGGCPCEIWVAAGTYKPDRGTGDPTIAFELFGRIALYGGFAGFEECLDERDWVANPTILSGDLLNDDNLDIPPLSDCCVISLVTDPSVACSDPDCFASVLTINPSCGIRWTQTCTGIAFDNCCELCRPTRCDNSQNVIRAVEPNSVPRLEGLTITAGEAVASAGVPLAFAGAGVSCTASSPVFSKCLFTHHRGSSGSAIHSWLGSPLLDGCTFSRNLDLAVLVNEPEDLVAVKRCVFLANDGGGLNLTLATATISDSRFSNNATGLTTSFSSVDIFESDFVDNRGLGANIGSLSVVRFYGSLFERNGLGGLDSTGHVEVKDSVFLGNRGSFGAGIDSGGVLFVLNSTIVGNIASGTVGGIWAGGSSVVRNSILWGNENIAGSGSEVAQFLSNGTANVNYNIVQGWTGQWGGVGNSGLDPLFVDPDGADDVMGTEDDDLRLSPDSPAINAGDPNYVAFPGETDLDGHPRVLCGRIDIGAYESSIGDYDCNRTVDLTDFAAWQNCVTGPLGVRGLAPAALTLVPCGRGSDHPVGSAPGSDSQSTIVNRQSKMNCPAFDFDGDGTIDLLDFAGLQRSIAHR